MKKSTSIRAAVIAALIHTNAKVLKQEQLQLFLNGLAFGVKGSLKNPNDFEPPTQTIMFVEGEGGDMSFGTTTVMQMPLELVEFAIIKFENEKASRSKPEVIEDKGVYIFLIGSVAFCQAAAHYMGSREGELCDSYAVHLIRKLTPLQERHVLWSAGSADEGREYMLGNIVQLMAATQEAA